MRGEGASSVTEILTERVSVPNVWRGDELADTGRWIIRFAEEDFADFERALAHVSRKHLKDVTEIRAEDFPLPHFQERIDDIVDRLEHGLGLVLLRGLPIYDRFSVDEATIIYWGMGRHMGNLVPQNRKGDLVGHIRDLGRRGPYERAYATNEDLGFHTDSTDFVGLMCLRPALYGGESFVASSGLLYNFVVDEHPEYLPILNKNFPTDWRSEEPPGSPGWYLEPLYSYCGGALSATVRTGRAMSAMRFPRCPGSPQTRSPASFISTRCRRGQASLLAWNSRRVTCSSLTTSRRCTPARHSSTTPMTQRVNDTCCDCGSAGPKPAGRSVPSTRSGAAATRPAGFPYHDYTSISRSGAAASRSSLSPSASRRPLSRELAG